MARRVHVVTGMDRPILEHFRESNARSQADVDLRLPLGRGLETFFRSYLRASDGFDKRRHDLTSARYDAFNRAVDWTAGKRTGVYGLHTQGNLK